MSDAVEATETPVKPSEGGEQGQGGTQPLPSPQRGFLGHYWKPLMALLGIVAAGGVSFAVNTWLSGHRAASPVTGAPRMAKVVYIDAPKIMADVIRSEPSGFLTRREAANIGTVVGSVIEQQAKAYAARGYIVVSQGVLAVPPSNNLTSVVEAKVLQQVLAIERNQEGK